jgi:hypothetical protein
MALSLLLLCPAGVAQAQSDEDKAAARSLWAQATEALAANRFEEAVDLASRAEALVHAPTHVILIARAQAKLGRLVAAKESYLKIVREDLPASAPGAFKKAQEEAKAELAAIEPRIASLKVVLEGGSGRKIQVKIDQQPVSEALIGVFRPIDPGKHLVVAYPPSLEPVEEAFSLNDGERKEVKLVIPTGPLPSGVPLAPGDNPDYQAGQPQPPGGTPDTGGGTSSLTWIGLGVGGVGLVGVGVGVAFTVIGGGTQTEADDLFASCDPGCDEDEQEEIADIDADAASQKTIGLIGLIGGGALLVGGAVLTVVGLTSKPEPQRSGWIAPYAGPGSFGVRGAF